MTDTPRETLEHRYPILRSFTYAHLPERLHAVSQPLCALAGEYAAMPTAAPAEVAAGLRKLLEAKDCFVRAAVQTPPEPE